MRRDPIKGQIVVGGEKPLVKLICMAEAASRAPGDMPRGQFEDISFRSTAGGTQHLAPWARRGDFARAGTGQGSATASRVPVPSTDPSAQAPGALGAVAPGEWGAGTKLCGRVELTTRQQPGLQELHGPMLGENLRPLRGDGAESHENDCEQEYVKRVGETETGERPRRQGEMKSEGT